MKEKNNSLKMFARQYRHCYMGGILYIEHPRPDLSFLDTAKFIPDQIVMGGPDEVMPAIEKVSRFMNYAYFWHKKERCYFVVGHLWLASLASWGPQGMKDYMKSWFDRSLSKVWGVPEAEEIQPVKTEPAHPIHLQVGGPQLSLLEKVTIEVEANDFEERYGISRHTYHTMKANAYMVDVPDDGVHILALCKMLYKDGVGMNDIYTALKKEKMITQSDDPSIGQFIINLTYKSKEDKLGVDKSYDGKTYPILSAKGIIHAGQILKEAGLINKPILPVIEGM